MLGSKWLRRRHLRYHAGQLFWGVGLGANFMVTNKQGLSFVQMVDLIKFKTDLNYKLNTVS